MMTPYLMIQHLPARLDRRVQEQPALASPYERLDRVQEQPASASPYERLGRVQEQQAGIYTGLEHQYENTARVSSDYEDPDATIPSTGTTGLECN